MTTRLRIKQVADASGFTPATLRYYEKIGLLPEASRSSAGYRMYDESTLARLAFVTRAKQLGCSLDEIINLRSAWDGGECGPIQDRLRQLVAGKLAVAHHQITELKTFATELRRASALLGQHRSGGACNADCGCMDGPGDARSNAATAAVVTVSTKPTPTDEPAIACTLSAQSVDVRIDEWGELLAFVERREWIDGGVRCEFAASVPVEKLIRLVAAERGCCQFFRFAITVDERGVALEARAPIGGHELVESMFGTP